ncbi:hypothetical protein KI387_014675, partial [Taxus chinensis]
MALLLVLLCLVFTHLAILQHEVSASSNSDFDISWGSDHGNIVDNGQQLQLTLDQSSGSRFQCKNEYLFGKIDMQIKLVRGNSAGTVTAYYLSSQGDKHDEIDFEFLGNLSGDPYIMHTNVFSQGWAIAKCNSTSGLTQLQTSTLTLCSGIPNRLCKFSVDGTPVTVFNNSESLGVAYPKNQAMRIYSSLWNADNWATRGGAVKIDWSNAPFVASYQNFSAQARTASSDCSASSCLGGFSGAQWKIPEILKFRSLKFKTLDFWGFGLQSFGVFGTTFTPCNIIIPDAEQHRSMKDTY